ncbi:GntR family transcriptional regulator [Maribacter sp. BPC-D8]|uniref:GntR family transcriptional regulator n=1 Tax=Maribacter sp. BPC-D8 TaxID=3053613 RepID=UPI002B48587F|nr:GntR family transcriptional regulator [Maribacter sp. BPC-D8]WRI28230.1 GntR family transcriptional regulator [Maribacter sp. BPC-D8]
MITFRKIVIDRKSRKPKYRQIVDSIIDGIATGSIVIDEQLPSINMFSEEFLLSRDTVEKAYKILKERKIITSVRGKGYFVSRTQLISKINVLFLTNKMSAYKMKIYNSFINSLGSDVHTDLFIYHCNESLFLNLLDKSQGAYDYYLVMPHFKSDQLKHKSFSESIINKLNDIPKKKLIIMDNNKIALKGDYSEVYQDFENDIYNALNDGIDKIKKYKKLLLVYPEKIEYPYPKRIVFGFRKFCAENNLDFEILNEIYDDMILKKGDLYITIEETDLVNLVHQVREDHMSIGEDIGIISYNDTPLKELLGITVISTDFENMGKSAAQLILESKVSKIKNPFNLIDRNSM